MKNLLAKMLAVQKAIKPIEKGEVNPHFKNKYFNIDGVIAALRPILNENGLVVTQPLAEGSIVTIVADPESGEAERYPFALPKIDDPQKLGAAITYYRRYALVSLFCLEAEDDDGNAASMPSQTRQEAPGRAAAPGAGQKTCRGCQRPFTPKFEWAADCYDCYKAKKDGGDGFEQVPTVEQPF